MAKKFIVVVLDGFGVGYMDDAAQVRPADVGANTLRRLCDSDSTLRLPNLERLGLMNAAGFETGGMKQSPRANSGRAALRHFGADTFWGHQEILGTRPQKPAEEPFSLRIDEAQRALEAAGFSVGRRAVGEGALLVVNDAATVADNIECDPGQAVNVTAALDLISFDEVVRIGRVVRGVVRVPRVIAFGGRGVGLDRILAAIEDHGEMVGVNAPGSGVYDDDYHCVHMGFGVDSETQAPFVLQRAGVPTYLMGKVADVAGNPDPRRSFSIVPTAEVMEKLAELTAKNEDAFLCANVQETDLAGHKEDAAYYIEVLRQADAGLGKVMEAMGPDDVLLVMADHGNDPGIGHPHHTREYVPLLLYHCGLEGRQLGLCASLADAGATACDFFGAQAPESGESFLPLIRRSELELRTGLLEKAGMLTADDAALVNQAAHYLKDTYGIDCFGKLGAAFVTHVCMSLLRKKTGEEVKAMDEAVLEELEESPQRDKVLSIARELLGQLGLPDTEESYIRLHIAAFFEE